MHTDLDFDLEFPQISQIIADGMRDGRAYRLALLGSGRGLYY